MDEAIAQALEAAAARIQDVHVVPQRCKSALDAAVRRLALANRANISAELNGPGSDVKQSGGAAGSNPKRSSDAKEMGLVVIEGEMGCGKEEAVRWLKRSCANRALRVVGVKLGVEDRPVEYSALARLFRLLVREENFDHATRQKLVVETLLREVYPNDTKTREKAYAALCHALGLTWKSGRPNASRPVRVLAPANTPRDVEQGNALKNVSDKVKAVVMRQSSLDKFMGKKQSSSVDQAALGATIAPIALPTPAAIEATLKDVFMKLLCEQPVAVVVEDAHDMDERSWGVFLGLIDEKIRALLVFTHEASEVLQSRNLQNTGRRGGTSDKAMPVGAMTSRVPADVGKVLRGAMSVKIGPSPAPVAAPERATRAPPRHMHQVSAAMHDGAHLRLSLRGAHSKIRALWRKCGTGEHIVVARLTPEDVVARLAPVLDVAAADVDPALENATLRLCGGQPFWLGEVLAYIRQHGLDDLAAEMKIKLASENPAARPHRGTGMAKIASGWSHKGSRQLRRVLSNAADNGADNGDSQQPRFAGYIPSVMKRLSMFPGNAAAAAPPPPQLSPVNFLNGSGSGRSNADAVTPTRTDQLTKHMGNVRAGIGRQVSHLMGMDTPSRQDSVRDLGSSQAGGGGSGAPTGRSANKVAVPGPAGADVAGAKPRQSAGDERRRSSVLGAALGAVASAVVGKKVSNVDLTALQVDGQASTAVQMAHNVIGVLGRKLSRPSMNADKGGVADRPVGVPHPRPREFNKSKESPHGGDKKKDSSIVVDNSVRRRSVSDRGMVSSWIPGSGSDGAQNVNVRAAEAPRQSGTDGIKLVSRASDSRLPVSAADRIDPAADSPVAMWAAARHPVQSALVMCRFNKLSLDEQIVVRIAAVVGLTVRLDVLDRAVPPPMRPYLTTILSTLVDGYWLTSRTVRLPHGTRVSYSFRNPAVRQAVYDIAMDNFRGATHLTVAEHLERECNISIPAADDEQHNTVRRPPAPGGAEPTHQYDLLCAGYHYSLSGMPAWKTVEFLCRACDDMMTRAPVSKVAVEVAVKLVVWGSQLVSTAPEVVVLLALIDKCRAAMAFQWPGTMMRIESSVSEGIVANASASTASCCLRLAGRQDLALAVSDPRLKRNGSRLSVGGPSSLRSVGQNGATSDRNPAPHDGPAAESDKGLSSKDTRDRHTNSVVRRMMSVMRIRGSDRGSDEIERPVVEERRIVPLNEQLANELYATELKLLRLRKRLYRERDRERDWPRQQMQITLRKAKDRSASAGSGQAGVRAGSLDDDSAGGNSKFSRRPARAANAFFAFIARRGAGGLSMRAPFKSIMPHSEHGGGPSGSSRIPKKERWFRQDLEEAEPWQRALIECRRQFSKQQLAAAIAVQNPRGATGVGFGQRSIPRVSIRPSAPRNAASDAHTNRHQPNPDNTKSPAERP